MTIYTTHHPLINKFHRGGRRYSRTATVRKEKKNGGVNNRIRKRRNEEGRGKEKRQKRGNGFMRNEGAEVDRK